VSGVMYESYISFLKQRKKLGGELKVIKEGKRLYTEDKHPSGMVLKWFYEPTADGRYIADKVGIPYEERR